MKMSSNKQATTPTPSNVNGNPIMRHNIVLDSFTPSDLAIPNMHQTRLMTVRSTLVKRPEESEMYFACMKSFGDQILIPIDMNLTPGKATVVTCTGGIIVHFIENEPDIKLVPLNFLHLYANEFVSTGYSNKVAMFLVDTFMEQFRKVTNQIISLPIYNYFLAKKPYVTVRCRGNWKLVPISFEHEFQIHMRSRLTLTGVGTTMAVRMPLTWSQNKKMPWQVKATMSVLNNSYTNNLPRELVKLMNTFGKGYFVHPGKAGHLAKYTYKNNQYITFWRAFSTVFGWTSVWCKEVGNPTDFWSPENVRILFGRQETEATADTPTGFIESGKQMLRALNVIAKADVIAEEVTEKVCASVDGLNKTIQNITTPKVPDSDLLTSHISGPIRELLGKDVLELMNIDLTQLVLNVTAAWKLKSTAIRAAFIVKMASQMKLLDTLMQIVNYIRKCRNPTLEEVTSDEVNVLYELVKTPLAGMKNFFVGCIGMLSGFRLFGWTDISSFWKVMLNKCRDLHIVSQGVTAISKLRTALGNILEGAMIFCNRYCGTSFDVFDEVKVEKNLRNMCTTYSTLADPSFCAAVCAQMPAVDKFIDLYNSLVKAKCHPRIARRPALKNAIDAALQCTANNRVRVNIAKMMNQESMTPYSVMLVGNSGIGKSTVINRMIAHISDELHLNKGVYHFNPSSRWMDGYNGSESFIVMDDIFKTKDIEDIKLILNLIGPGIFLAPVAMNETRPTVVNTPVMISSSNTTFVDCPELTCPDAVDRRFVKWEMKLQSGRGNGGRVDSSCVDVSFDELYEFRRLPATNNEEATSDQVLSYSDFIDLVTENIKDHIMVQSRLVRAVPGPTSQTYHPNTQRALMEILTQHEVMSQEELNALMQLPYDITTTFNILNDISVDEPTMLPRAGPPKRKAGAISLKQVLANRKFEHYCLDNGVAVKTWGIFSANVEESILAVRNADTPFWHFKINGQKRAVPVAVALNIKFHSSAEANQCQWTLRAYNPSWTLEDCYDFLPQGEDRTATTASLWDGHIVDFTLMWNSLSSHERAELYNAMTGRVSIWKGIYNSPLFIKVEAKVRSLYNTIAGMIECLGMLVVVTIINVVVVGLVVLFIIFLQDWYGVHEPTSNYQPKSKVKETIKPSDFAAMTFTSLQTSDHVQQTKVKIHSNLFSARFTGTDGANNFNMIGLQGQFYAIPKHVIYNRPTKDGFYTLGVSSRAVSTHQVTRYVEHTFHSTRDVSHIDNRDITIIRLENRSMVPDIVRHMPLEPPQSDIGGHVTHLYWKGGVFGEMSTTVSGTNKKYTVRGSFSTIALREGIYTSDAHDRGTSGGACILLSNKCERRLVGMLSSSNFTDQYGVVTPFVKGEVDDAIAFLNPNVPTCSVEHTDCPMESPIIGESSKTIGVPNKTGLQRTPLYGIIGVSEATPVLSRYEVDHLEDGRFKTEKVEMCTLDPVDLNTIAEELGHYYKVHLYQHFGYLPRVKSLEKAITGDYIGGKHIELTTSPGIGKGMWCFDREKPGKTDFIKISEDGSLSEVSPLLVDIVNKQIRDHLHGHVTETAFAQFPKDELRPAGKKARSIDGSPLEDQVEYRMLFGEMDGMLNALPKLVSRSGPGLDLQSQQGHELAELLRSEYVRPFVYDVKKWDANITLQLWEADSLIANTIYGDGFSVARKMLLRQSCLAPIVSGKYVIQPGKGMRSGYPGTANTNTRIHLMLLVYCIKRIMRKTKPNVSLTDVFSTVFFIAYADDIIGAVADPLWFDAINGSTIASEMERLGFAVVDPNGKTDQVKSVADLTELSFLKHTPTWSGQLNRFIWKIELASIQNCVNYTSGNDFSESLDSIFYHAYPHGESFYESTRQAINDRLYKRKIAYPISYGEMTRRWEKENLSAYPEIVFQPEDSHFDE